MDSRSLCVDIRHIYPDCRSSGRYYRTQTHGGHWFYNHGLVQSACRHQHLLELCAILRCESTSRYRFCIYAAKWTCTAWRYVSSQFEKEEPSFRPLRRNGCSRCLPRNAIWCSVSTLSILGLVILCPISSSSCLRAVGPFYPSLQSTNNTSFYQCLYQIWNHGLDRLHHWRRRPDLHCDRMGTSPLPRLVHPIHLHAPPHWTNHLLDLHPHRSQDRHPPPCPLQNAQTLHRIHPSLHRPRLGLLRHLHLLPLAAPPIHPTPHPTTRRCANLPRCTRGLSRQRTDRPPHASHSRQRHPPNLSPGIHHLRRPPHPHASTAILLVPYLRFPHPRPVRHGYVLPGRHGHHLKLPSPRPTGHRRLPRCHSSELQHVHRPGFRLHCPTLRQQTCFSVCIFLCVNSHPRKQHKLLLRPHPLPSRLHRKHRPRRPRHPPLSHFRHKRSSPSPCAT